MQGLKKIFINKKILIYGLGLSGISSFNFLKKENDIKVYDDNIKDNHIKKLKKYFIKKNNISKFKFDYIVDVSQSVAKLFDELGPRYKDRPGGYLRVIKRGYRPGDKAPAAQVEFVQEEAAEQEDTESLTEETA